MRETCGKPAEPLRKRCGNSGGNLRKLCRNSAGTRPVLRGYCADILRLFGNINGRRHTRGMNAPRRTDGAKVNRQSSFQHQEPLERNCAGTRVAPVTMTARLWPYTAQKESAPGKVKAQTSLSCRSSARILRQRRLPRLAPFCAVRPAGAKPLPAVLYSHASLCCLASPDSLASPYSRASLCSRASLHPACDITPPGPPGVPHERDH